MHFTFFFTYSEQDHYTDTAVFSQVNLHFNQIYKAFIDIKLASKATDLNQTASML